MVATASTKPAYLGLLNGISLAEGRAGVYLKAWAAVTPDAELRQALSFVAGRETSHGVVFRQRIERLGFAVQERDDAKFTEQVKIYGDPTVSDREKIRYGRYGQGEGAVEQFFASIDAQLNDESIDQLTRDTLRWYVHEERDSGEVLNAAYARCEADGESGGAAAGASAAGAVSADAQAIMACMTQGFTELQQSLKDLVEAVGKPAKRAQG